MLPHENFPRRTRRIVSERKVAKIGLHGGGFETVSRDRLTNSLPGFSACRVFSDSVAGETGGKI